MFTANKIYGKYRTGNDFFRIKEKKKNEIGKNQSSDPVEQDINLVWPNVFGFLIETKYEYLCKGPFNDYKYSSTV